MKITSISLPNFAKTTSGERLESRLLSNSKGLELKISNFGPRLLSLQFPDSKGKPTELMLNYPDIQSYETDPSYQGQIAVGPYANRIGASKYIQPDTTHPTVSKGQWVFFNPNDGPNFLHSGKSNWGTKVWNITQSNEKSDRASLTFSLSCDPNNNQVEFPGLSLVELTITITESNELHLDYLIKSERTVPMNPTFHGYFNLNGTGSNQPVTNHLVQSNAHKILPVNETLIPFGYLQPVKNSRFDFSQQVALESVFEITGFDHCFVFPPKEENYFTINSPETNIQMDFYTDQPSFQLYTGSMLPKSFKPFQGFCLEAQKLVNGVNHPEWEAEYGPSFLKAGQEYKQHTVYRLSHNK